MSSTYNIIKDKIKSSESIKNDSRLSKYSIDEIVNKKIIELKRKSLGICGQTSIKPFYEIHGILISTGISTKTKDTEEILDSFKKNGLRYSFFQEGYLSIRKIKDSKDMYEIHLYTTNGGPK